MGCCVHRFHVRQIDLLRGLIAGMITTDAECSYSIEIESISEIQSNDLLLDVSEFQKLNAKI